MSPAPIIAVLVVVLVSPLRAWRLPESGQSEHSIVLGPEATPAGESSSLERLEYPPGPRTPPHPTLHPTPHPAPRPDTRQHARLVEIVPTKHRTKKGNALAYIVPKSSSVKKKLNKQKIVAGIVVQGDDRKLGRSLGSTEDSLLEVSESRSSESNSETSESESDSKEAIESAATDRGDSGVATYPDDGASRLDPSNEIDPEDNINNMLNGIVSYYKEHSDRELDTVVHDVLPHGDDPQYHVHYLIHNKRTKPIKKHEDNKNTKYTSYIHAPDHSNRDLHQALQHYFHPKSEYNEIDEQRRSQSQEREENPTNTLLLDKVNDHDTYYDDQTESHHNHDHHKHDHSAHDGDAAPYNTSTEDVGLLTDNDDILIHVQDLIHKNMSNIKEILSQIESNINHEVTVQQVPPSDIIHPYYDVNVLHLARPEAAVGAPAGTHSVSGSEQPPLLQEDAPGERTLQSVEALTSDFSSYLEAAPSNIPHYVFPVEPPLEAAPSNIPHYVFPVETPYSVEDGLVLEHLVVEDTSEETAESGSVEVTGQGNQGSGQAAIPFSKGKDIVFSDYFKMKKKKKTIKDCDESKTYTLMFLFNK